MSNLDNVSRPPDNGGRENHLNFHNEFAASFAGLAVPDSLQANVDRHHAHLLALVDSLGRAGVDEATIERSIVEIVASYQAELIRNMKTLYRDVADA